MINLFKFQIISALTQFLKGALELIECNRLRIPTGRRQTSWLCASAAEELNEGLPETKPADGQSGD